MLRGLSLTDKEALPLGWQWVVCAVTCYVGFLGAAVRGGAS